MTFNELKEKLSTYGHIEIISEKTVFTLLLTGNGLTKMQTVSDIQKTIIEYVGDKYPVVEAMKNNQTFFCIVLKPKQ